MLVFGLQVTEVHIKLTQWKRTLAHETEKTRGRWFQVHLDLGVPIILLSPVFWLSSETFPALPKQALDGIAMTATTSLRLPSTSSATWSPHPVSLLQESPLTRLPLDQLEPCAHFRTNHCVARWMELADWSDQSHKPISSLHGRRLELAYVMCQDREWVRGCFPMENQGTGIRRPGWREISHGSGRLPE